MVNIPALRDVMTHVTAHRDQLNMNVWGVREACGTTACIAGWQVILDPDYQPAWRPIGGRPDLQDLTWARDRDGGTHDVDVAAARGLGLTAEQAEELFYADTLDEVWEVVERITEGAVRRADVEPAGTLVR